MFRDAHLLLREESNADFDTLMRLLSKATEEWLSPNQYIPRDRNPTPFHVLFQCVEAEVDGFKQRLHEARVSYETLDWKQS